MADKVFAVAIVLPDRVIENGFVLVADGLVQLAGSGPAPAGERHGGPEFLSRPAITEALAIAEVYELGAGAGCPVHIVHCSIGRGYELAAGYRAQGYDATVEACIHYLTLDEDEENDVRRLGGKAKINPPLRPRAEVESTGRCPG